MTATKATCKSKIEAIISEDGISHGWLGWFDARVGNEWLSTSPLGDKMHWGQVFLPLTEPISIKKTDKVSFALTRPEFGEWSWIVSAEGKRQKQSTFLSEPINTLQMMKQSAECKPVISEKGKITQKTLQFFNGGFSITEIIVKIKQDHQNFFSSDAKIEKFVKNLVEQYT